MTNSHLLLHTSLKEGIICETIIKKSRFICELVPVIELEQAQAALARIKKLHYNATHNCSAMLIGANMAFERANDDGEPQGTAGVPMLDVLKKSKLTNTLAVVTRYFGGIMLGAGGLARAYGGGVADAVKQAKKLQNLPADVYSFVVNYSDYGKLCLLVEEYGASITAEFAEAVSAEVVLEKTQCTRFCDRITQAFLGANIYSISGEKYITQDLP